MTRVLVTGGRELRDRGLVYGALDAVRGWHSGSMVLVHGAARGADQLAHEWAVSRGVEIERHPAMWEVHGKAAGPIRNREMVERGADLCVAFPGGTGTADCIRVASAAGIRVLQIGRSP